VPAPVVDTARIVIVGGGIAGAATAAALARAGAGPGLVLEREAIPGMHASGRNAGIACLADFDPIVRQLALETVPRLRRLQHAQQPVVRARGSVYLGDGAETPRFDACAAALREGGARAERLDRRDACRAFPFLDAFAFDVALLSADEGVFDIHAVLLAYLEEARRGRFSLLTRTAAMEVRVEHGRVAAVATSRGVIRCDVVIDASGAWAGRLGRGRALPLSPLRRHLFTSGEAPLVPRDAPLVWHVTHRYYLRPDGAGLLLSPCDESPHPPGAPEVDPSAAGLLASKLLAGAPALADVPVRTSWACLRTFAPDRRPVIGADPEVGGLFHVAALGGMGMSTSWAVGEIAAAAVRGVAVPFVGAAAVHPARVAGG
jgi:D-arginine dehydrogenase